MPGDDAAARIAATYLRFAHFEAQGRSPAYEQLAESVAGDPGVLGFLAQLPPAKWQPNLLFAAATYLLDAPPDRASLRSLVDGRPQELAATMRSRRTQTNEPARCALLLPALGGLPEPLALIEVGASAGLTLLVDRYSYEYAGYSIAGHDPAAPVLSCRPLGPVPLPDRVPSVSWRAGLDLNPLDVDDPDDVRWLSCLLWPDEGDRADRLAGAVEAARRFPVPVRAGDLLVDLPRLVAEAPPGATVVVYHTAVLAYVDAPGRRAFAALMSGLRESGVVWLSNEAPGVVAEVSLPDVSVPAGTGSGFVLVKDGREVLAVTDPHGSWIAWSAGSSREGTVAGR